jgi:hypothetical protein
MGHHTARNQCAEERPETDFHHMTADQQDHAAMRAGGRRQAGDDGTEIPRGEHIGQGG